MSKIFVAVFWLIVTSVLIRYSSILAFSHDTGIAGSLVVSATVLWLYAFFKAPSKGK